MTLPLQRITDFLDKAFKAPRSYYPVHIYDDSDVVTREESEKRIKFGLLITGIKSIWLLKRGICIAELIF